MGTSGSSNLGSITEEIISSEFVTLGTWDRLGCVQDCNFCHLCNLCNRQDPLKLEDVHQHPCRLRASDWKKVLVHLQGNIGRSTKTMGKCGGIIVGQWLCASE